VIDQCDNRPANLLQLERLRLLLVHIRQVHAHPHEVTIYAAGPLTNLVRLSDLLCRVRHLGYGYDEIMGIDLRGDAAWQSLVTIYPALRDMDLVRFTLDIDGAMEQIVETVDSVFGAKSIAASTTN